MIQRYPRSASTKFLGTHLIQIIMIKVFSKRVHHTNHCKVTLLHNQKSLNSTDEIC